MLQADRIAMSIGAHTLFQDVSFVLNPGDKVGLVGINGSGKTTLLRILAGLEQPCAGAVTTSPGEVVGYLPQTMEQSLEMTVRAVLETAHGDLAAIARRMREIQREMAAAKDDPRLPGLLDEYGELATRFESQGGYEIEHRTARVLTGLELDVGLDTPLATLSGGQRIKVALARLLLANPSILLLDEPTNNLDLPALIWLEGYLHDYPGSILVVSHDRRFLDRVVTAIIELDEHKRTTTAYAGNYSSYRQQRAGERRAWEEAYKRQQAWVREMEEDIRRTREQAQATESATNDSSARRLAKKVARKARARERRLERAIEGAEMVEKPNLEWGFKIDMPGGLPASADVLVAEDVHWWYGEHHVLRGASLYVKGQDRVAILGKNGTGKTTLLRLLAGRETPPSGRVRLAPSARVGYLSQDLGGLDPSRTVLDEFRDGLQMPEAEARRLLSYFLFFGHEVFKAIGDLSLGERAKLVLGKMVVSGLSPAGTGAPQGGTGANLLILDEPTNHMDDRSLGIIESTLRTFKGAILVVSHDRYFLDEIGVQRVYVLGEGQLLHLPGGYDAYERMLRSD